MVLLPHRYKRHEAPPCCFPIDTSDTRRRCAAFPSIQATRSAVVLLPLLALPLVVGPVRTVAGDASGRALLPVLAATGRLQLAFGILLSVSLWLWIR